MYRLMTNANQTDLTNELRTIKDFIRWGGKPIF